MASHAALTKADWLFGFAMELLRVRPRVAFVEAEARARLEWEVRGRSDPQQAARRWLGEQARRPST